ncbi:hypothetical protein NKH74_33945 [Mesorhizobium sp. M0933]|uniref:hypothetical protein n=1 Tax=Mesorhizobium sp. M0933 TaxID=2957030 RepID=UPI00333839F7
MRLTAIRSFFTFVSFEEPAHSALIQRVLAIPSKRHDKRQVHFLTRPEIEAVLAAPQGAEERQNIFSGQSFALQRAACRVGYIDLKK